MAIQKKDRDAIVRLAKEGKTIASILAEDYPEQEYWEIYEAVYGGGEMSALGAKRMIANRLKKLPSMRSPAERRKMIQEIDDLVWHLYHRLKLSQKKLDTIRKELSK